MISVKVANSKGKVEIELKKTKDGHRWLYLGKDLANGKHWIKRSELGEKVFIHSLIPVLKSFGKKPVNLEKNVVSIFIFP